VGGYRLLFVVLAGLAGAVAALCGTALPAVEPVPRVRETLFGLVRRLRRAEFIGPVAGLAAATAALSAGVGFLPVVGARAGLGPLATGAIVSAMAAAVIVVQIRAGRELDTGRLPVGAGLGSGLVLCGAGLILAGAWHGAVPLLVASLAVGTGVGVATPLGFAALAAAAPAGTARTDHGRGRGWSRTRRRRRRSRVKGRRRRFRRNARSGSTLSTGAPLMRWGSGAWGAGGRTRGS
jgi:DHA1 family tetracycline resistance protein-like MFS transporter